MRKGKEKCIFPQQAGATAHVFEVVEAVDSARHSHGPASAFLALMTPQSHGNSNIPSLDFCIGWPTWICTLQCQSSKPQGVLQRPSVWSAPTDIARCPIFMIG
jgi:hypothetical protein